MYELFVWSAFEAWWMVLPVWIRIIVGLGFAFITYKLLRILITRIPDGGGMI